MLQAPLFDGLSFDPFALLIYGLPYLTAVRGIIALTANVIMLTPGHQYSCGELQKFKFS